MGSICCPEISITNYHSTLRETPEERRSHLHRGGNLKTAKYYPPEKDFLEQAYGLPYASSNFVADGAS
jgi:hypothetical protein